ncbi:MAG: sulfur carrier protein ThiS [Proteobacteria bacterium]|nr:sulfur carrier protein ThiS [Pseudomonadota bacterium]
MITIQLNGKKIQLLKEQSLSEALISLGYESPHIAVAINEVFIPRTHYVDYQLQEHDRIEIVSPMQGG